MVKSGTGGTLIFLLHEVEVVGTLALSATAIAADSGGSPASAGRADTDEKVDGLTPSPPPPLLPPPALLDVVRVLMLNTETLVFDLETGDGSMNTGGWSEDFPLLPSPCLEVGVLDPDAAAAGAADASAGAAAGAVATGVSVRGVPAVSSRHMAPARARKSAAWSSIKI